MIDIQSLIERNRNGEQIGLPCFCTANEHVLRSVLEFSASHKLPAVIEATCNQVNQDGGYTGMVAKDFANWVGALSHEYGVPDEHLILGGDHLGPNPWRHLPAKDALSKAEELVRSYAAAGFRKIHLDASMACADESTPDFKTVATRAARLCAIAEEHSPHPEKLVYIIGTEVPVPGGETDDMSELAVTHVDRFNDTIDTHKEAFEKEGLSDTWSKIVSIVTQPGVDFSHEAVYRFNPDAAHQLSQEILKHDGFSFEAHSTDYQPTDSLASLVQHFFFFLKVGPELTFRMREAVFALAAMQKQLSSTSQSDVKSSDLIKTIDAAMDENTSDWAPYYTGDAQTVRQLRHFSYSDRIRYYWNVPSVKHELQSLLSGLDSIAVPETIISQHFPTRDFGALKAPASQLIRDHVKLCLQRYYEACGHKFV